MLLAGYLTLLESEKQREIHGKEGIGVMDGLRGVGATIAVLLRA